MAKFRIFNIQLLPKDSSVGEVGVIGYKNLFRYFREATKEARREKKLGAYHRRIGREGFFGPMEFHPKSGYVWGHFVRYTKTDQVEDLYTRRNLYKGGAGSLGVSAVKEIIFLFDCKRHFFAIEEKGNSIPPPADLVSMLEYYLHPIAAQNFSQHDLHISLVADKGSLESVLADAVAFSHIDINLSFPNGPAEDTLDQLKAARMQKLQLVASPGRAGKISKKLPDFVLDLLKGAMTYGNTKITYFVPDFVKVGEMKRKIFSSISSPLTFEKRQSAEESDDVFAERCVEELKKVVDAVNLNPTLKDGEVDSADKASKGVE